MIENNPRNSQYFASLPKFIQESIMQSGLKFENEDDMRQFVSELENTES